VEAASPCCTTLLITRFSHAAILAFSGALEFPCAFPHEDVQNLDK
jgi:hypothetical protein